MITPICPNCGHELIEDGSYDFFIDISECQEYVVGYCENCGKKYQWINIFSFSRVENIEEVS